MTIRSTVETLPDPRYDQQLIRHWAPEGAPRTGVALIHGLAEHSGRYERTGSLLAAAGFAVAAPDLYGFGESGGPRADVEEWDHYFDQIEHLISRFSESGLPTVLMGHSMGALIGAGYLLADRPPPDSSVLSAPAIGGGAAWQRVLAAVIARLAPWLKVPNNVKGEQLSRDPDVGEAYFADPLVITSSTTRLGNHLFEAQKTVKGSLDEWSVDTLVMHGGSDTIVPPQSTVVLGTLDRVERRLYPKLRHEILNEPEGPQLVAEIVEWLDEQLPG